MSDLNRANLCAIKKIELIKLVRKEFGTNLIQSRGIAEAILNAYNEGHRVGSFRSTHVKGA